jgi:hypothetical protein
VPGRSRRLSAESKPVPSAVSGEESFASVAEEVNAVQESKGPVVGQRLGGEEAPQPVTAGKPARTLSSAEKALVEKMAQERLAQGLGKLNDIPELKQAVESSKITLADGKTTLRDLAADAPDTLREMWSQWNAGRQSGRIKSSDFGEYVKVRQREARGAGGELAEAFGRGQQEILIKAPKADVTEPGTDLISYDKQSGRIKLIDNKAVRSGATVSKVSALEENLSVNLGDDITQIEAYAGKTGVPSEVGSTLLPRLRAAKAEIDAYTTARPGLNLKSAQVQQDFSVILARHGIDRVVTTSGGGRNVGISPQLATKRGFTKE